MRALFSGVKFAYQFATIPHVRFEAKRTWRKNYREWRIFDAERQLTKIGVFGFSALFFYLLATNRLFRIFARLPSEDPNYLMKSQIFQEEHNAMAKRREEAEKRLMDSNLIVDRGVGSSSNTQNPFGDTIRPTHGGSPLYTSGDGVIPSPTTVTGIK